MAEKSMSEPTRLNAVKAFETLEEFLEGDDWHPRRVDERYLFRMSFKGNHGQVTCFAHIREDLEQLLFYVVAPFSAPEERRPSVAEFIARANYGLRIGNFELDFTDGELRYKSSVDFEGVELKARLIKNAIYPAVQTMDRYLPGLMAMIYGDKAAEEAIRDVEGGEAAARPPNEPMH